MTDQTNGVAVSGERLAEMLDHYRKSPMRQMFDKDTAALLTELQSLRLQSSPASIEAVTKAGSDTPFGHEYGEGPKLANMFPDLFEPDTVAEPVADDDRMQKISEVILHLQSIQERFGDTCVYIRRGGMSWGAVALNRRDDDRKNGVFDLQAQHDLDTTARLQQVERLIEDNRNLRTQLAAPPKPAAVSDAMVERAAHAMWKASVPPAQEQEFPDHPCVARNLYIRSAYAALTAALAGGE